MRRITVGVDIGKRTHQGDRHVARFGCGAQRVVACSPEAQTIGANSNLSSAFEEGASGFAVPSQFIDVRLKNQLGRLGGYVHL